MLHGPPQAIGVTPQPHDVVVVGAGAVGLVLGIGLARAGFDTAVIGPEPPARPGRTVALLAGSVHLLERLELWNELGRHAAPMKALRIVDATGSLFRPPPVLFEATEIGLPVFGSNIENADLERIVLAAARATPGVTLNPERATDFSFAAERCAVSLESGTVVSGSLVAAADGRHSLARKQAGIGVSRHAYGQAALTTLLSHEAPHQSVSTEFHTRSGPFTLVPLNGTAAAPHRSSLVWVMRPDEAHRRRAASRELVAAEIEAQSQMLLGRCTVESEVGTFPIESVTSRQLCGPRLVLTGEAAHALPPIGAQGLNLSFRDVATLLETLRSARDRGEDIGRGAVLDRYARLRRGDVALRSSGVEALNGSLLAHNPIADLARGVGLGALGRVAPLRRWVMRHGLAPELARGAGRHLA